MTATATVTIPYNEFQAIQDAKIKAELETAAIKEQLTSRKIESSDATLLFVARAAIEVVRFAVANLPPETTKNWPTEALRKIAVRLSSMPDASPDDQELSITLFGFADECDLLDGRRRAIGTR